MGDYDAIERAVRMGQPDEAAEMMIRKYGLPREDATAISDIIRAAEVLSSGGGDQLYYFFPIVVACMNRYNKVSTLRYRWDNVYGVVVEFITASAIPPAAVSE